jgi:molybdate/tungstate transport system permease protein
MATQSNSAPSETGTAGFGWLGVALLLGGVLLLYYSVPVVLLFLSVPPGELLVRMNSPIVVDAATTSVLSASVSTLIATVFGVPLAYWLARTDGAVQTAVLGVVVLPLVLPPVVGGIVLLTVFGPGSPLGEAAIGVGFPLTRSLAGVVLAQTFVASPFVVVTAKVAFERVDQTLEYASRSLGKSRWQTARYVTVPLAGPGIIAGVTLTFARAIGEFGATMMMAYYPRTMPVQIWVAFIELGLENAYPVAVLLVVIAAVTLLILDTIASNPWE